MFESIKLWFCTLKMVIMDIQPVSLFQSANRIRKRSKLSFIIEIVVEMFKSLAFVVCSNFENRFSLLYLYRWDFKYWCQFKCNGIANNSESWMKVEWRFHFEWSSFFRFSIIFFFFFPFSISLKMCNVVI